MFSVLITVHVGLLFPAVLTIVDVAMVNWYSDAVLTVYVSPEAVCRLAFHGATSRINET